MKKGVLPMKLQTVAQMEIPDNFGDFQALEGKIRDAVFRAGRELMTQVFSLYEAHALGKKSFSKKDQREKTYQTLIGEWLVTRWRVWDHKAKRHRYPLDEWVGLKAKEKITAGLKASVIEAAVQRSYRRATQEITRSSDVKRSTLANWRLIQREAQEQRAKEPPLPDFYQKPLPILSKKISLNPCPILAIDPDATYCRGRRKQGPDHEIKMAVLYDAKEPENKNKTRWRLKNKQIIFSRVSESFQDFCNRVAKKAFEHYGAHYHTQFIMHGDGDSWIRSMKTNYFDKALIRLDPWHLFKNIRMATDLKKIPPTWIKYAYQDPDRLILALQQFRYRTKPNTEQRLKLTNLIAYISNNREGLLPSGIPQNIKQLYPRMFKRGSGTIERNIGHAINDRFKRPRMCWSETGLDNLLYLREKFLNQTPKPKYYLKIKPLKKVA